MKWAWISTGLGCLTLVERSVGFFVGPSQCLSRKVSPCTNRGPKSYPPRGSYVSLRTFLADASLSNGEEKKEALRTLTSEPGDYQQHNEEKEELITKLVTGAKHVLAALEKDAKVYSMMKVGSLACSLNFSVLPCRILKCR